MAALLAYVLKKTASNTALHAQLTELLAVPATEGSSTATAPKHVGLVVSERLVNMPAQVVPPMFRMLEEELQWARDDVRPVFAPSNTLVAFPAAKC